LAKPELSFHVTGWGYPGPASKNENHIKENMAIADYSLSQAEMDQIDARAKMGTPTRYSFDEYDFTYDQCWPKKKVS